MSYSHKGDEAGRKRQALEDSFLRGLSASAAGFCSSCSRAWRRSPVYVHESKKFWYLLRKTALAPVTQLLENPFRDASLLACDRKTIPMSSQPELSPKQLQVIDAIAGGATVSAAAQQAGVHRNTVANWRRHHPLFAEALAVAQYDKSQLYRERAEDLVDLAFQTLASLLADPQTPASVRLKAALHIIDTASTPPAPAPEVRPAPEASAPAADPYPRHNEQTQRLQTGFSSTFSPSRNATPASELIARRNPPASAFPIGS